MRLANSFLASAHQISQMGLQGHSQPFQNGKSKNFLQPRWMIIGPFSAISEGQISKIYDYRGILSHFGYAISISQMALFYTYFLFANFAT